jgi:hypothetical protein
MLPGLLPQLQGAAQGFEVCQVSRHFRDAKKGRSQKGESQCQWEIKASRLPSWM